MRQCVRTACLRWVVPTGATGPPCRSMWRRSPPEIACHHRVRRVRRHRNRSADPGSQRARVCTERGGAPDGQPAARPPHTPAVCLGGDAPSGPAVDTGLSRRNGAHRCLRNGTGRHHGDAGSGVRAGWATPGLTPFLIPAPTRGSTWCCWGGRRCRTASSRCHRARAGVN